MKRIIYTRPDGGISVIIPAEEARIEGQSENEFIAWVRSKDVPADATNVQIVDEEDIPTDRTFRNAWKQCPKGLPTVDMEKARDIHRDRLRAIRKPKLENLDVEFMRAVEGGKSTTEIAAAKQALRDITKDPAIDAAKTPDELKMVWPGTLS